MIWQNDITRDVVPDHPDRRFTSCADRFGRRHSRSNPGDYPPGRLLE
jgi:hypothetical protein